MSRKSTSVMRSQAQNIYDKDEFFKRYCEYPRMTKGIDGASEWPRLYEMLPPLAGRSVLDLACGDAWFARFAAKEGAAAVVGGDLSYNMLARAAKIIAANRTPGEAEVALTRIDLEDVHLPFEEYDVVFSGLALHYVSNLNTLLKRVYDSLAPGGTFVFSIEHPMFTAPIRPGFRMYADDEAGDRSDPHYWPVDSYFAEGERVVRWLVDGVRKQHRTMGTYLRLLGEAGFVLRELDEWGFAMDAGRKHPDWPEDVCPRFLLVSATKGLQIS